MLTQPSSAATQKDPTGMSKQSRPIRTVIMRGGTSRGLFIRSHDLPDDPDERDRVIMALFGTPDRRQIDGLGGADLLTSKLAIIAPSHRDGADVEYTFVQVGLENPTLDYNGNCGNISAAVGPYAIEEGLVAAVTPTTVVRIYNTNPQDPHSRSPRDTRWIARGGWRLRNRRRARTRCPNTLGLLRHGRLSLRMLLPDG